MFPTPASSIFAPPPNSSKPCRARRSSRQRSSTQRPSQPAFNDRCPSTWCPTNLYSTTRRSPVKHASAPRPSVALPPDNSVHVSPNARPHKTVCLTLVPAGVPTNGFNDPCPTSRHSTSRRSTKPHSTSRRSATRTFAGEHASAPGTSSDASTCLFQAVSRPTLVQATFVCPTLTHPMFRLKRRSSTPLSTNGVRRTAFGNTGVRR
jgi:hypothetical protein